MMEFKQIIDNFKAKNVQAGKLLGFSLLPLLMKDLVANGLNISHADGKFYQDLAAEVFSGESKDLQIDAVDVLVLYGRMIPAAPQAVVEEKPAPKAVAEAIVEDDIIRTDHLVDNIPNEDDEGDPFYIPPEERLNLKPEDCEPAHIDHEFMALIGAKGYEK